MICEKFLSTIRKFRMIQEGDTVLVAVSGGCDSTSLLFLLNELKSSWKLKLGILHVNHQLRGADSERDENFVRKLGQRFKIPVSVARVDVKKKAADENISLEEAARLLRYDFFERTARSKRAHCVAVAHTQDDQAETVLMRILTGTGLQGLQAIRPKRKLNGAYLIRPLIEISRADLEEFAKKKKIRFRTDETNRSIKFLRNRIRHDLLPRLERDFNPQIKKVLARLPHLLDVDVSFLAEFAKMSYQRLAKLESSKEVVFSKSSFSKLHPAIQYRLISFALKDIGRADLDFEHWKAFHEKWLSQARFKIQMPKGVLVSVSSENVRVFRDRNKARSFSYLLPKNGKVFISEIGAILNLKPLEKMPRQLRKKNRTFEIMDADQLTFPLVVRTRRPGDRFQPLGQTKPQKLKSFLINQHVPVRERDRLPLLISQGTIVWVVGVALGEAAKVTSQRTKRFVRASFCSEKPF